jgi:hypothetical protein
VGQQLCVCNASLCSAVTAAGQLVANAAAAAAASAAAVGAAGWPAGRAVDVTLTLLATDAAVVRHWELQLLNSRAVGTTQAQRGVVRRRQDQHDRLLDSSFLRHWLVCLTWQSAQLIRVASLLAG